MHESVNTCDILSSQTSMQNSKVQLQKFIANINVKVKFLINIGSSANILCYETLNEISKLNMNNNKVKKTSVKLIPFGSSSQNSFIRGCSYEGELVRLGGLARLVEISPSLRNSYKNMCSYEK